MMVQNFYIEPWVNDAIAKSFQWNPASKKKTLLIKIKEFFIKPEPELPPKIPTLKKAKLSFLLNGKETFRTEELKCSIEENSTVITIYNEIRLAPVLDENKEPIYQKYITIKDYSEFSFNEIHILEDSGRKFASTKFSFVSLVTKETTYSIKGISISF